jgi:alpha-glucosidase
MREHAADSVAGSVGFIQTQRPGYVHSARQVIVMKTSIARIRDISVRAAFISTIVWVAASQPASTDAPQIRVVHGADVVEVQAVAPNIVRIHFQPGGKTTPRTLVMDPGVQPVGTNSVRLEKSGENQTLWSPEMKVVVSDTGAFSVQVQDSLGKALVTVKNGTAQRGRGGSTVLEHDANESLYGIHGLDLSDNGAGILRNSGGVVAAGVQGNAGGPFYLAKRYAVLVDSDGGAFQTRDESIRFGNGSRPDTEYFVIVGPPMKSMAALALLTGKPPIGTCQRL